MHKHSIFAFSMLVLTGMINFIRNIILSDEAGIKIIYQERYKAFPS